MNTARRIAKNTGVLLTAQVLRHLIGFFYMMYTARYLGAAGFGILSFALAFTAIFSILTDFGLQPLTIREVARDKTLAPKYLANLSAMKIVLVIATFGLIAITINLLGYPQETIKVVYLVTLSIVLNSFTTMLYSIFQAYERMEYQSLGQIINAAVMLTGVILAMKLGLSVVGFALLYFLSSIVCLAYSFFVLKMRFFSLFLQWSHRKVEIDWDFWKATAKEAIPFGLGMFFVIIFYWIDSVMLSVMKGDEVVGWYNVAYRMVLVLLFIPQTFIAAIYPAMSASYKTSVDSLQSSHEKSFKYLTIIGVPIAIGTTLLAQRLVLSVFGKSYTNSILPLQILVWSAVFIFMSITFGNLFNCLNRQSIVTKITGICVLVNVALNIILVPKFSLIGASIATVMTEFVSLSLFFGCSFKNGYGISPKNLVRISIKVLISGILMGIYIIFFHDIALLILLPSAVLIYFLILFFSNGIDNEDILLLQNVFLRK
jgi:O-antigen/teichoic acid export membrane protein